MLTNDGRAMARIIQFPKVDKYKMSEIYENLRRSATAPWQLTGAGILWSVCEEVEPNRRQRLIRKPE